MRLLYFNKEKIMIIKIFTLCTLIESTNGYPILKAGHSQENNERTFPNGTVVGKYNYKDNEGNPVHVKYFADASGYGVELKTVKVIPDSEHCQDNLELKYRLRPDEERETSTFGPITDLLMSPKPADEFLKDLKSSEDKYKTNSDYELFVKNELKSPEKCGQNKVHVYHEENKRRFRQTVSEFDALKYCEQMFD